MGVPILPLNPDRRRHGLTALAWSRRPQLHCWAFCGWDGVWLLRVCLFLCALARGCGRTEQGVGWQLSREPGTWSSLARSPQKGHRAVWNAVSSL